MLGRRWGQLCPTYPIPLASQLFPRLSYSSYPHTSRWAPLLLAAPATALLARYRLLAHYLSLTF